MTSIDSASEDPAAEVGPIPLNVEEEVAPSVAPIEAEVTADPGDEHPLPSNLRAAPEPASPADGNASAFEVEGATAHAGENAETAQLDAPRSSLSEQQQQQEEEQWSGRGVEDAAAASGPPHASPRTSEDAPHDKTTSVSAPAPAPTAAAASREDQPPLPMTPAQSSPDDPPESAAPRPDANDEHSEDHFAPPSDERDAGQQPPQQRGFEANLLHELQEIVARDCGGSAKLLIAGGFGASQGKRSVFRLWRSVLERHEAMGLGPQDPVDPALFESVLGGDYLLQDLHVLDLASLQWSEPVPKEPMPCARAAHTATAIPVRVTLPLPGPQAPPARAPRPAAKLGAGESVGAALASRDVDVASLMRAMSAYVAELQQAVGMGERETVGKFLFECFLASLRRALMTQSTKGLLSQQLAEALLDTLLGDRPHLREMAGKVLGSRLRGKTVELIHVEDVHAALMATKGAVDHLVDVFVNARTSAMPIGGAHAVTVQAEVASLRPIHPAPDHLVLTLALERPGVPEISSTRIPFRDAETYYGSGAAQTSAKPTTADHAAPGRLATEHSWALGLGADPEIVRAFSEIAAGDAPSHLLIKLQASKTGVRLPGQASDAAFTVAHCRIDLRTLPRDLLNGEMELVGVKKEVVGTVRLTVAALPALKSLLKRGKKSSVEAFKLMLSYGKTLGGLKPGPVDESLESLRAVDPCPHAATYDAVANTWKEVRVTATDYGALPRAGHSATRIGRHLLVFGGLSSGEAIARLEAIDLQENSVRALSPSGAGPSARAGHAAVFIEAAANPSSLSPGCIVYFGGTDGSGSLYMDTYVLRLGNELITSAWDYPSIAGDPVRGRCNHAACVVRRSDTWQMFVFGGRVFSETRSGRFELTNTLLCLQPREPSFAALDLEWKQMQCSGPLPPARELSTLQAVGNKVLMCGGWLGLQQAPWIRDFWILDTERMGWVSLVFEDRWPSARFAHSAAMVDYRSTSLRHCTLHAIGLLQDGAALRLDAEAGRLLEIEVHARDAHGLLVDRGGDFFLAIVRPASKAVPGPILHPQVEDLGWGCYRLVFVPTRAGDFVLTVADELGAGIGAGPLLLSVRPGPVAPGRTLVLAPTIHDTRAGDVCSIALVFHDMFGNRVPHTAVSREQIAVSLGGPELLRPAVTPCSDSDTVTCDFTPTKSGKYMLTVRVGSFHVDGSPFRVHVRAAAADITRFAVTGKVLQGNRWFSGTVASVLVAARDRFGNRNFEGGDDVMLSVSSDDGRTVPVSVVPGPEGTYKCHFTPEQLGTYSVACFFQGRPDVVAEGCPFFFKVSNSHLDMRKCEISGEGYEGKALRAPGTLVAGEEVSLRIQARDEQGNKMEGGNDHFLVWIERADGRKGRVLGKITDHGDGSYTAAYAPKEEGVVRLFVEGASGHKERADYTPHPTCPKEMNVVSNATDPAMCQVTGPGVGWVSTAGQATSFTVLANDKHGNRRRVGGDLIEVVVEGEAPHPTSVKDLKDGAYVVTYRPTVDRKKFKNMVFRIAVSVNGRPIANSPFFQRVAVSRASAAGSFFENPPDRMTAGEPVQFFLVSCNEDRKPLIAGGEDFRLTVTGNPTAHGELKDMRDGRYLIRLVAEELDSYRLQVTVTLHDQIVGGKPLDLLVVPEGLFNVGFWAGAKQVDEALASQFLITGAGSESAIAGERAAFEIVAKRLDDLAPASAFQGELRGPENVPVTISGPFEGGIYKCHYVAIKSGHYNGIVKIGRVPLPGSPLQLVIEGDVAEPALCEAAGPGLSRCVVGQEASFRIHARDQHGNPARDSGRDYWRVAIIGGKLQKVVGNRTGKFRAASTEAKVFNNKDSTYTAKYILPQEGAFSLDIFHSTSMYGPWTIVAKSPYSIVSTKPPEEREAEDLRPAIDTVDAAELRKIGAQQVTTSVMTEAAKATAAATGDVEAAQRVRSLRALSRRYGSGAAEAGAAPLGLLSLTSGGLATTPSSESKALVPSNANANAPPSAMRKSSLVNSAATTSGGLVRKKSARTSIQDPGAQSANQVMQEVWKKDGLLALGTWGQRDTMDRAERAFAAKEDKSKTRDDLQLAVEELAAAGALQKRSVQMEMLSKMSSLAVSKERERRASLTSKSAKSQKFILPPI